MCPLMLMGCGTISFFILEKGAYRKEGSLCFQRTSAWIVVSPLIMNTTKRNEMSCYKHWNLQHLKLGLLLLPKGWVTGELKIYLRWQPWWSYDDKRRDKFKESSTISPIDKEHQCPFGFPVIWDEMLHCFKIKGGLGERQHLQLKCSVGLASR